MDSSRPSAAWLFNDYVQKLSVIEAEAESEDAWEDYCFLCKDGGDLICCEWGWDDDQGIPVGSGGSKCRKAYHLKCVQLAANDESDLPSTWHCPRHACNLAGCGQTNVSFSCPTCPRTYCAQHLTDANTAASTAGPNDSMMCKICTEMLTAPLTTH